MAHPHKPPFSWPPAASQVAILRGHQRPASPVLLTLFPPRPQQGQPRGFSSYYPSTAGPILCAEPALLAAIEAGLRHTPTHSLGLVVNAALPEPADWGTRPEHFPQRARRNGQPLTSAEQQAYQAERCQLWASGRRDSWCAPKQWGASIEHIADCSWLFAECDREGFPAGDQLALAEAVFGAPPSFSIHTGGKSVHCYYRLAVPITRQRWAELQTLVIGAYGQLEPAAKVDGSLKKPNQVMRLAGGYHPRTGALAAIHTATGTVVDPAALELHLQALQPPPPPEQPPLPRPTRRSFSRSHGRHRVRTLEEIAAHLATIPRRIPGHGTYAGSGGDYGDRNTLWGLVKACEKAGHSIETAIALMEAHSPSASCGWDVQQVATSGGAQATPAWFWGRVR